MLAPEKLSRHDSSGSIPDSRHLFHSCDILGASLLTSFATVGLFTLTVVNASLPEAPSETHLRV